MPVKTLGKQPEKQRTATKRRTAKKTKNKTEPNKVGRPTDYNPAYCDQIIEFFDKPAYEIKEVTNLVGGKTLKKFPADLPLLENFAKQIGVCRDTLNEWTKVYPDFANAVRMAKDSQKIILVTNGLNGGYNNAFAIFTAKNITDMKDKVESELGEETRKILEETQRSLQALANLK